MSRLSYYHLQCSCIATSYNEGSCYIYSFAGLVNYHIPCFADGVSYAGTDIEEIRERALSLYDVIDASGTPYSVVFPELRFTCSGNITSVWFIASENEDHWTGDVVAPYPEFQLWQRGRTRRFRVSFISRYRGEIKEFRSPPASGFVHMNISSSDMALYEYRLEDPMQFEAGDVLGMYQWQLSPLLVRYLNGGGVRNYVFSNEFGNYVYTPNGNWDLEPLLALNGEPNVLYCSALHCTATMTRQSCMVIYCICIQFQRILAWMDS